MSLLESAMGLLTAKSTRIVYGDKAIVATSSCFNSQKIDGRIET
jgi:hypothetical protein